MDKPTVLSREDVVKHLDGKTEFEKAVLLATYEIPKGKVSTYGRIARRIGRPRAYRAVGNALHKNPLAPIVPCHRVVRSDGYVAGTREAVEARSRLLKEEGIAIEGKRIKLNRDIVY